MIYIILALLLYSIGIMFAAAASRHLNTNLAAAIMGAVSTVIPLLVIIPLLAKKGTQSPKFGILMAVAAGILISLFVMALNKSYAENKVGIVAPVVFGGAIFLSTILSYFIFKEKVSHLQTIGLIFLAIGFSTIIYARVTAK